METLCVVGRIFNRLRLVCVIIMNRPLVAIGLVAFIPTISILFTLNYNDDETTSQIFFLACKLWLLVAPAYWYLRVEGKEISRSPAD